MGLLDFFRKNKEVVRPVQSVPETEKNKIERTITRDGEIQIDFYRGTYDVRRDYDCTRLVILNKQPENMYGCNVYDCKVSWYHEDDAIMLDEKDSRHDFKDIKLTVDPYFLQTDDTYATCLMNELLDRTRVNNMLARGMQDNPDRPCGNYVGSVILNDGNYVKYFNDRVGMAVHHSKEMAEKRRAYQEKESMRIAKDAKRKELQRQLYELDNLDDGNR